MKEPVPLRIVRRIDSPAAGLRCATGRTCPAALELSDGRIAIIGRHENAMSRQRRLASGKTLVVVPGYTLLSALSGLEAA